jgi:hypothetical protein
MCAISGDCPHCGTSLRSWTGYCPQCGKPLPGREYLTSAPDDKFCHCCGRPLDPSEHEAIEPLLLPKTPIRELFQAYIEGGMPARYARELVRQGVSLDYLAKMTDEEILALPRISTIGLGEIRSFLQNASEK